MSGVRTGDASSPGSVAPGPSKTAVPRSRSRDAREVSPPAGPDRRAMRGDPCPIGRARRSAVSQRATRRALERLAEPGRAVERLVDPLPGALGDPIGDARNWRRRPGHPLCHRPGGSRRARPDPCHRPIRPRDPPHRAGQLRDRALGGARNRRRRRDTVSSTADPVAATAPVAALVSPETSRPCCADAPAGTASQHAATTPIAMRRRVRPRRNGMRAPAGICALLPLMRARLSRRTETSQSRRADPVRGRRYVTRNLDV